MPVYQTSGTLTGTIARDAVPFAQDYLEQDDMTNYVDEDLKPIVLDIRWSLNSDGHRWGVRVITSEPLTPAETTRLESWISGQNSDGLGEGFEQQTFAETGQGYTGSWDDEDDEAGGDDDYGMISFDWKTNPCTLVRLR